MLTLMAAAILALLALIFLCTWSAQKKHAGAAKWRQLVDKSEPSSISPARANPLPGQAAPLAAASEPLLGTVTFGVSPGGRLSRATEREQGADGSWWWSLVAAWLCVAAVVILLSLLVSTMLGDAERADDSVLLLLLWATGGVGSVAGVGVDDSDPAMLLAAPFPSANQLLQLDLSQLDAPAAVLTAAAAACAVRGARFERREGRGRARCVSRRVLIQQARCEPTRAPLHGRGHTPLMQVWPFDAGMAVCQRRNTPVNPAVGVRARVACSCHARPLRRAPCPARDGPLRNHAGASAGLELCPRASAGRHISAPLCVGVSMVQRAKLTRLPNLTDPPPYPPLR